MGQGPDAGGGECSICHRPLQQPDLEAVAASIDQTLSMEAGRMVPRTAWAGGPPDGMMDTLLSWLPSVKSRRHLWERGQQLWTEQMTAALSGPCEDCQHLGTALPPGPGATQYVDPYQPPDYHQTEPPPSTEAMPPPAPTSYLGTPPDSESEPIGSTFEEGRTSYLPSFLDNSSRGEPPQPQPRFDAPTTMNPPFDPTPLARPAAQEPEPAGDEHESHTVILSSMPHLRTTTRLVVLDGPVHGRQFSLGRAATTIGRSIGSHVTVESDTVAYDHARIVRSGSGWTLELATPGAELFVNDEPVQDSRSLRQGDVIRVGPARLKFESVS